MEDVTQENETEAEAPAKAATSQQLMSSIVSIQNWQETCNKVYMDSSVLCLGHIEDGGEASNLIASKNSYMEYLLALVDTLFRLHWSDRLVKITCLMKLCHSL
eukprot:4502267-Amphidinium_carterae.1